MSETPGGFDAGRAPPTLAATGRAGRLRIGRNGLVTRGGERIEARNGELGRSHEDYAHGQCHCEERSDEAIQ